MIRKLSTIFAFVAAVSVLAAAQTAPEKTVARSEQTPVTFVTHEIATGLVGGYQAIAVDMNNDGKPDIVALASRMPELAWYENPTWARHVLAGGFTQLINVAAADLDGDGIPELAVASGFSTRPERSMGIVQLLTHGAEVREPWTVKDIDRVPATHRLRWIAGPTGQKWLIDAPLAGATAQPPDYNSPTSIYFYRPPDFRRELLTDEERGVVHAVEPVRWDGVPGQVLLSAGFTGIHLYQYGGSGWKRSDVAAGDPSPFGPKSGSSDAFVGHLGNEPFLAAIEPWHGSNFVVYRRQNGVWQRQVVDPELVDGHATVVADFDGDGRDEVVIGQRQGQKRLWMYRADAKGDWVRSTIDEGMAGSGCYGADFNGDRRIDLVCINGTTLKWYENMGGSR